MHKQGVIRSVSFAKKTDLVYEVVYKDDKRGDEVVELVSEDELAYAANCPVIITRQDGSDVDGIVLLPKQSYTHCRTFVYTVMISVDGTSQAQNVDGIDSKHIKYRKVKTEKSADESSLAQYANGIDAKENEKGVELSLSSKANDEQEVPLSITCHDAAVGASSITSETESKGCKRVHADIDSDSLTVSSRTVSTTRVEPRERQITVPEWLQRDSNSQRVLFFSLIGSKRSFRKGVVQIGKETDCFLKVNYNDSADPYILQPPLTITITMYPLSPPRALDTAYEQIQRLLITHCYQIGDAGAAGRCIYETAQSCSLVVSESRHNVAIVGQLGFDENDPWSLTRAGEVFLCLVELPFLVEHGRKVYHARCVLQRSLLSKVGGLGCLLRLFADGFGIAVKSCEPYVTISGQTWQAVDHAVAIVKEAIDHHTKSCGCSVQSGV